MTEEQAVLQKMGQEHAAHVADLQGRIQGLLEENQSLEGQVEDWEKRCMILSRAMRKLLKVLERAE